MNEYILFAYLIWNLIVFFVYGIDKLKAKVGTWRVPEKTLLLCALFFGAIGAYAGMKTFRHKTKHKKFKILIPLFLVLNIVILVFLGINTDKVEEVMKVLDISF